MNHSPFAVIGDTFWWQMRKPKIGANLDKNFSKKIFTTLQHQSLVLILLIDVNITYTKGK